MHNLPVAGEYMHRDMFDACRHYGKDTFMLIHYFGTDVMPRFFALKGRLDAYFDAVPFLPKRLRRPRGAGPDRGCGPRCCRGGCSTTATASSIT